MTALESLKFRYLDSFIHRIDPRVKFFVACSFAGVALLYTQIYVLLPLLAIQIIILLYGKVIKAWLSSLKIILVIAVIVFLISYITTHIVSHSVSMAIRWAVFFTSFSWFLLTTSPDDFGQAFEQMGFPHSFSFSLTLATRFVPLIANQLQLVYDAQRSRGLEMDKGDPIRRIKNLIPILIPLIVSVIRRSFELAESLSSRGYGVAKKRTRLYEIKMKLSDYLIFIFTLIFLIFSIYIYASTDYQFSSVIAVLLRLIVPLSIFRSPLWGTILSMLLDFWDCPVLSVIESFGNQDVYWGIEYHLIDKILDIYYLFFLFFVSFKWKENLARKTSIILFYYRILGSIGFLFTGERILLVLFPNIFENFFLFYLIVKKVYPSFRIKGFTMLILILLVVSIPKIIQEYFTHYVKPDSVMLLNKYTPLNIEEPTVAEWIAKWVKNLST